ncbi:MAG: DUF4214 domain-containing protein [Pyrinomonadaceae bacterium]
MRRITTALMLALSLLSTAAPVKPYTFKYTTGGTAMRWPANTITVAFSSSLSNPGGNIKAGTDVVGTVRRALQRWSFAANIQFIETQSNLQSVSPSGGGDGVSLITIADTPENRAFFSGGNQAAPGRTRIFTNGAGQITEADVVINPAIAGGIGFSTDATSGTYDLEAVFTHEFGHLLGLDHSGVVGATMQPRLGQNFFSPALTARTLEDDDLAGIRALYGARTADPVGTLQGHVNYGAGAHVWAENFFTGRIHGSAVTKSDGSFEIQQLPPGQYRVVCEYLDEPVTAAEITANSGPYAGIGTQPPFTTVENQATVNAGAVTTLNLNVNTGTAPTLHPSVFGVNGQLIASATPLAAGQSYRFYIGGFGLNSVPATGFTLNTPFMTLDPNSYRVEDNTAFGVPYPIVSFDLLVKDNAKFGDYSMRLQRADTGEISYVSGGLALDPYTDYVELNPIDQNRFFVIQQYLDFLFRQPDTPGLNAWLNVLNNCSDVNNNPSCDRILVSGSFFGSPEFQLKGYFVYRFYKLSFNRLPAYAEIVPDMRVVTGSTQTGTFQKRAAFVADFVTRPSFLSLYPDLMPNATFVNTLMDRYNLQSITTPDPANPDGSNKVTLTRADLINSLNSGTLDRAKVLRAIADSDQVFNFEYNQAFVLMQYIGYLRRDPETSGYNAWLNYLNSTGDFRTMISGFVNSKEYRARFGQP